MARRGLSGCLVVGPVAYRWRRRRCWAMRMRLLDRACAVIVLSSQVLLQTEVRRRRNRVDALWGLQIEDAELTESRSAISVVCLLVQ